VILGNWISTQNASRNRITEISGRLFASVRMLHLQPRCRTGEMASYCLQSVIVELNLLALAGLDLFCGLFNTEEDFLTLCAVRVEIFMRLTVRFSN
jgi:hypothetical protein